MSKSKCCGAEVSEEDFCMRKCCKCKNFCDYADLAPALRDSKEILEFVEKLIESVQTTTFKSQEHRIELGGFFMCCEKIKNYIEGKE